jgi:hypothetical protein
MAMLKIKTLIGVCLGITFFASQASAECAWVLWWEESLSSLSYRNIDANIRGAGPHPERSRSWNILGAYPTNAACEGQQAWKIGDMLDTWRKEKAEGKFGEHTITHKSGSNIITRTFKFVDENTSSYSTTLKYLCLPDTIDPRGPKGK